MMNVVQGFVKWLSLVTYGGPTALKVVKAVVVLVLSYYAITDNSKLKSSLSVPASESVPARVVFLGWEPSVSVVVTVVVLTVWAAGVAGYVCVAFPRLKIRGVQSSNGHCRVVVDSGGPVRFGAYLASISPAPARAYPYEGAPFQIDGVPLPYLVGEIPPHPVRVNVCVQQGDHIQLLFARDPPQGQVLVEMQEYRIELVVYPVHPFWGGTTRGFFRIIQRGGKVELIRVAPEAAHPQGQPAWERWILPPVAAVIRVAKAASGYEVRHPHYPHPRPKQPSSAGPGGG